jgi:hypothetical protein
MDVMFSGTISKLIEFLAGAVPANSYSRFLRYAAEWQKRSNRDKRKRRHLLRAALSFLAMRGYSVESWPVFSAGAFSGVVRGLVMSSR